MNERMKQINHTRKYHYFYLRLYQCYHSKLWVIKIFISHSFDFLIKQVISLESIYKNSSRNPTKDY